MSSELFLAVAVSAIAGPELDKRIAEYESGAPTSKEDILRDLKTATNLASMLALAGDAALREQGL